MDITQVFELPQSTFDAVQIHLFFVPVINYWWGAFKVHIKNWFQTINLFLPQNLVSFLPALDYGEGVYVNQLPTVLYSVYHYGLKFVVASSTAVYSMLIIPSLNVRWYIHWMVYKAQIDFVPTYSYIFLWRTETQITSTLHFNVFVILLPFLGRSSLWKKSWYQWAF